MTRGGVGLITVAVAAALAACTSAGPDAAPSPGASTAVITPPPPIVVPEQSLGTDVETRIADNVTPPTNRWYSSLAFGEPGLPVFPKPLSFAPVDGGFTLGLTTPTASANAIVGAAVADVQVTVEGAEGFGTVTRADPVGVALSLGEATISLAQGWPVVGVVADAPVTLSLGVGFETVGDGIASAQVGATTYGVLAPGAELDGTTLRLDAGESAQFFAVPTDSTVEAFAAALGDVVGEVRWQGSVADGEATTTLEYGNPTVVVMPQQRATDAGLDCTLGTYATIDGTFAVCEAGSVSWSVPALAADSSLGLAGIGDDRREAIGRALEADVAALAAPAPDSYFGGKYLYRVFNLLEVAEALSDDDSAESLRTVLWDTLREWAGPERCATTVPRCFVYDPTTHGIVGVTPAFGSEDFNDHHFHYGYLLYAAAGAAARDPELAEQIAPVFDLVAADIASGHDSGSFPAIRNFDPVAGHSWASGYAPFGDANNQESSSEAVAAWNAVALWAQVRGDDALEQRALWMLASEADAARRLWLEPDLSDFPDFGHPIVAIEWGGKRDYATWFSAEPAAMLGIQLIPMAPFAPAYLNEISTERVTAALAEAAPDGYDVMFGDYLLMYAASTGVISADEAWEIATDLPAERIDDGDSRTYLLAYIAALGSS